IATRATIIKLLRDLVQAIPDCVLVLDGLDECTWMTATHSGHNSIASFLETVVQALDDTSTRILIVSRDEAEIRLGLDHASGCSELKISHSDVQSDVYSYSKSLLDKKLPKKDVATRNELSRKMADRCEGQFLILKLQTESLRSWRNKKQLEADIKETPSGLDTLYQRDLSRMFSLSNRERSRAFAILRWLVFALRPLTVSEITEALLINVQCPDPPVDEMPDSIDDNYIREAIVNPCGSLLEVRNSSGGTDEGSRTIHLKHFSVRKYFLSNAWEQGEYIAANARLGIFNETVDNAKLSVLCLHYINYRTVWGDELSKDLSPVMT
ncbi:hypothetical protein F5883DRAFT_379655, partial [Diaporthe sp. PMI_573]